MKYIVLSEFADLQDKNHVYGIGSEYPRKGYSPTAERIDELSTGKNLLHIPLIQLMDDPIVVDESEKVVEEVAEEPKRKRGKKTND